MRRLLTVLLICGWASPVLAVTTSHWTQENATDFKAGTSHNVVVTNLGDVKLSRAIQTIKDQEPNVTTVNALAQTEDGTIYAGTGPKGVLLSVKDDKVTTAATIADAVNILSLCVDDQGGLYIGTGGAKGKVYRVDKSGDAPREIFSSKDVQYIWALQRTSDGNLYAATGPNGQVFEIKPDGSSSVLFKSSEDNITSLLSDGQDLLFLGTDPNGLVIRLNRKTKDWFVMYNASESDITALATDSAGNLYAATGEVTNREQQAEQPPKDKTGRPEGKNSGEIPAKPSPAPPKPPTPPAPGPDQPKPIPKHSQVLDLTHRPLLMDGGDSPGGGDNSGGGDNGDNGDSGDSGAPDQQTAPQPAHPAVPQPNPPQGPEGNAIYKIDKDGFVTEIFRQDSVIYSMVAVNDVLIVGTGDEGNIFQVNPGAEETVILAKVDAKQVVSLLPTKDGRVIIGVANTGGIAAMTGGFAPLGTFTSSVLDATQVSRFGNMQLHGQLPDGTSLKIATRSGNVKDPTAMGWAKWSDDVSATEYVPVAAPSARFLQYRLTFATTDSSKTPVVDHVDVAYQIPNMSPAIKSIKIATSEAGAGGQPAAAHGDNAAKSAGTGMQTISWDASDANGDTLIYSLYFRQEQNGPWILLKDKLKETNFEWDTHGVADGRYQIKVVASDAPSNPAGQEKTASRVSDSLVVDNTPPNVGDITVKVTGADATISARAADDTSIITAVDYTVDSADDWQTALPVSNIFDSQDVTVAFAVKGLTPGDHQVTIRATDRYGNQSLRTVAVTIEPQAAGK